MLATLSRFAVFLATEVPAEGEVPEVNPYGQLISTVVMMGLLIAAMYFFMIRPESKRKKASAKMRDELIVGDEVTTVGGIVGRVVSIKDDTIVVETGGDKTRLTFVKNAVSSKVEKISS